MTRKKSRGIIGYLFSSKQRRVEHNNSKWLLLVGQKFLSTGFFSLIALFIWQRVLGRGFFSPSSLLVEQRAQAEAVFRLMVDSIIGLAILMIIMTTLGNFYQLSIQQSLSDLQTMVRDATKTPTGSVLTKNLLFSRGTIIDDTTAQSWTNVSKNCFRFDTGLSPSSAILVSGDRGIQFTQNIQVKGYARCCQIGYCDPTNQIDETNCCIECIISFGKQPDTC